jgi:hypothetical protein
MILLRQYELQQSKQLSLLNELAAGVVVAAAGDAAHRKFGPS